MVRGHLRGGRTRPEKLRRAGFPPAITGCGKPPSARVVATAAVLTLALAPGAPGRAADSAHPVVVELFQSQGCSSCPPANANVMAVADRPGVLALSFQVTYWDGLGWKDTFAQPAFTDRQWSYARAWRRKEVATPEVVVDGRRDLVGSDRRGLEEALKAAGGDPVGPAVAVSGASATVSAGRGAADVWLVRYDPRVLEVPIRRGENGGRTLPHRNVVRELVRLGTWSGHAQTFTLPRSTAPIWRTAVLVQAGPGGPILSAARG